MVEVPEDLKDLAGAFERLVGAVQRSRKRAEGDRSVDYAQVEAEYQRLAQEIERTAHEKTLSQFAQDAERVIVGGRTYVRVLESDAVFRTRVGEVRVNRWLYREEGVRNGETIDPIELRIGSVDRWLPGAARQIAHLMQEGTSREAETTTRELGVLPYSRSSFQRVGDRMGELFVAAHAEIEAELIERLEIPKETYSASLSIDRVSLPMEEPRPRGPGRPRKDAPANPIQRVYRMAYCGTLTLHDSEGRALYTIRYGRMPTEDPAGLCDSLAADLQAILRKRPFLKIAFLADGAAEMWNLFEEHLSQFHGTRIVDFYHVVEKLAAAAKVIEPEGSIRLLERWKSILLNRKSAAALIRAELESSGKINVRVGKDTPVREAITYLTNQQERMVYRDATRQGLPIGSGNVEATCKTLVQLRMKRPGARWKSDTGAGILYLRATAKSDRWDDAMTLLAKGLRRCVRAVA